MYKWTRSIWAWVLSNIYPWAVTARLHHQLSSLWNIQLTPSLQISSSMTDFNVELNMPIGLVVPYFETIPIWASCTSSVSVLHSRNRCWALLLPLGISSATSVYNKIGYLFVELSCMKAFNLAFMKSHEPKISKICIHPELNYQYINFGLLSTCTIDQMRHRWEYPKMKIRTKVSYIRYIFTLILSSCIRWNNNWQKSTAFRILFSFTARPLTMERWWARHRWPMVSDLVDSTKCKLPIKSTAPGSIITLDNSGSFPGTKASRVWLNALVPLAALKGLISSRRHEHRENLMGTVLYIYIYIIIVLRAQ